MPLGDLGPFITRSCDKTPQRKRIRGKNGKDMQRQTPISFSMLPSYLEKRTNDNHFEEIETRLTI
jgi:hypothetical protein